MGRYAAATQTLGYADADLLGLPAELFTADVDLGLNGMRLRRRKQKLRWTKGPASELNMDGYVNPRFVLRSLDYDIGDTHIDRRDSGNMGRSC